MKTMNILLLFSFISFSSCGDKVPKYCEGGWDTRLKIVNNSANGIYVMHSAAYPDTNSYSSLNNYSISKFSVGYVNANSNNIQRERCTWDNYFTKNVKSDTLMIFIILDEGQGGSLHLDLEKLKERHTVLKRYSLTMQDLEKQNWTITYP